jgi:3-oxoacyl-[acyl-carrier protein] reductase
MGRDGRRRAATIDPCIALKRLGVPDDIAHAVLFFASDWANWVSGQILSVDGGK